MTKENKITLGYFVVFILFSCVFLLTMVEKKTIKEVPEWYVNELTEEYVRANCVTEQEFRGGAPVFGRPQLRQAFLGSDPLAFETDPEQRKRLEATIALSANPEQSRKRAALAAYFSHGNRDETGFAYENIHSFIRMYHGKEMSIEESFDNIASMLSELPEPKPKPVQKPQPQTMRKAIRWSSVIILFSMVILILKRFKKKILKIKDKISELPDRDKYFCMTLLFDLLLLFLAACDLRLPYGFYTILRIVTCVTGVWFIVLLKSPVFRFLLGLVALLYNPLIPIELDDRDAWQLFNILVIVLYIVAAIVLWRNRCRAARDGQESA